MNAILDWGAGFIQAVQGVKGPAMNAVMLAVTFLGTEYFFLAALPFLFWCVDERRAARIGFVTFFSLFVNVWIKDAVALPRPYQVRPELHVVDEIGYSFPSWHAQGSATFWPLIAFWSRRPWAIVLGVAMPLAIGFTRIYLGVHYPTDVLAGWAIGAAISLSYQGLQARFVPMISRLNVRFQVALVAAASWLMCALHMADVAPGAAFFGIGLGYVFSRRRLRFSAAGSVSRRALRFVVGGVVLGGIYAGLKVAFPKEGDELFTLFRFVRYAALGLWVTFGAPWLFIALKLAEARPPEAAEPEKDPAA
jgi:membrane-associated phospholipid phosphatase